MVSNTGEMPMLLLALLLGLGDGVGAILSALALLAVVAEVEGIDPLDEGGEMGGFVGEYSGLEVSFVGIFGTHSCTG